jgi:hypothetical protein
MAEEKEDLGRVLVAPNSADALAVDIRLVMSGVSLVLA